MICAFSRETRTFSQNEQESSFSGFVSGLRGGICFGLDICKLERLLGGSGGQYDIGAGEEDNACTPRCLLTYAIILLCDPIINIFGMVIKYLREDGICSSSELARMVRGREMAPCWEQARSQLA